VFAALSVADQIERLKSPVYGIIEGLCASAATFIALSCHKRFITPHSFILAHEFSSGFYGRYQEFKDEVVLQDMLFKTFVDFYAGKTNLTVEDLHDKLKHNWWLDAKQAVEFGFVDFILGE
jgi:ATP-dependent Clp protease protease subunit